MARPQPLASWHFTVLSVLAVGLPVYFLFYLIVDWDSCYEGVLGEGYRRTLGFTTGLYSTPAGRVWAFTSITPGGVFDRAGVRVGDTPVTVTLYAPSRAPHGAYLWNHGYSRGAGRFYYFLHSNAGRGPVAFEMNGCSGRGHPSVCSCTPRKIVIEIPPPTN